MKDKDISTTLSTSPTHHSLSKQAPTISQGILADLARGENEEWPRQTKMHLTDTERTRLCCFLKRGVQSKPTKGKQRGKLLLGWVVREFNTLGDVALQAFYTGLEEGLLVIIDVCEWVYGLLSTAGLFRCQLVRQIREGGIRQAQRARRRSHSQSPWQ